MLGRETDSIQAQARGQTLSNDVDLSKKKWFGFRGVVHWSSIFPACPPIPVFHPENQNKRESGVAAHQRTGFYVRRAGGGVEGCGQTAGKVS